MQINLGSNNQSKIHFAEVQFYFCIELNKIVHTLALVSLYSHPHPELLKASYNTLWSCTYSHDNTFSVIDVKSIQSVIAMISHQPFPDVINQADRYFVVEKPGLGAALLGDWQEGDMESDKD